MANNKKFVVKNGLQANNIAFVNESNSATVITASMLSSDTLSFSGNTGQLFSITDSMTGVIFAVNDISGVPSIEVDDTGDIRFAELTGNVSIGTTLDTHKLYVNGNTYVNGTMFVSGTTINSTFFGATANNSTYLNGQLASYYTNASNITTGTLPYAQIPANVTNTTSNFTITGAWTFNANVTFGPADHIVMSSTSGISANGTYGAAGQVLTSNGTAVYWSSKGVNYTLSSTPPTNPEAGDVWIDDDDGTRYEYLIDANGGQWVDFTSESSGTPVFIQNSAPTFSGSPYLWIQTGLPGNNITFWVEDGQ